MVSQLIHPNDQRSSGERSDSIREQSCACDEEEEETIVSQADAVPDPRAVVVKATHTPIANFAVLGSLPSSHFADVYAF